MKLPATFGMRRIEGRRKDLTRVRDLELDGRALSLEGPGIASITGIQRFLGLRWLYMLYVREPDLGVLSHLDELELLDLGELRGDVDYRPVEQLEGLRWLSISVSTPADARAVSKLDLSRLASLEHLELWVSRPQCPISLGFLDSMPLLDELLLVDFVIDAEDARRLAARQTPFRRLMLTARDRDEAGELLTLKSYGHQVEIHEQYLLLDSKPMLRVEKRRDRYELSVDIATEWGLDDNRTAEAHLRELLSACEVELSEPVEWRSDVGELIAVSRSPRPLRELERFIASRPAEHRVARRAPSSRL